MDLTTVAGPTSYNIPILCGGGGERKRQDTEAEKGSPLAQEPMDQNWTARNADLRPPGSEDRELCPRGTALTLQSAQLCCPDAKGTRPAGDGGGVAREGLDPSCKRGT